MSTYHEELKNKETLRLREIQKELPAFTQSFFRGIAQTTSTKTRLAYAYDLRIFFPRCRPSESANDASSFAIE